MEPASLKEVLELVLVCGRHRVVERAECVVGLVVSAHVPGPDYPAGYRSDAHEVSFKPLGLWTHNDLRSFEGKWKSKIGIACEQRLLSTGK